MGGAWEGRSTSGSAAVFPLTLEAETMVVMVLVTWLTVVGEDEEGSTKELGRSRGLGCSTPAVS